MLRYIIGISVLTLGIIIVRALSNGKVLRKYQYAFWIAIPLYMILMPFVKIDVPVADIWNNMFASKNETATYEVTDDASPMVIVEDLQIENDASVNQTNIPGDNIPVNETIREQAQIPANYVAVSKVKANESKKIESILQNCCYFVSAILVVALIAYNIGFITYCKRKRKYIGKGPSSGLKIYSIKHKETPFLMFNKIYIDNDSINNEYVICHEACHYKHGDHLWVLIRYLVLFLNWYNPVIWAAFILSGRDCELACDEAVMKAYGADSSKDYARTLLEMLQQQSGSPIFFTLSTGMKSGYKLMKKRIISIKKPADNSRKALALSMAVILFVTSCSFVNASKNVREVSANDPWWNDTEIIITPDDIKQELNKELYDLFSRSYAADEDSVLIVFQAYIKDSNNDVIIQHYSYEGTLLGQVILSDYFGAEEVFYAPETLYKLNNRYYAVIQHYDKQKDSLVNEGYEIDFEGGTLKNPFSIKFSDDGSMFSDVRAMVGVEDKLVYLMSFSDFEQSTYKICIDDGKNVQTFTPDFGNETQISYISNFVECGNGVSFTADVEENGVYKTLYCTLNIDTYTLDSVEIGNDSSWLTSFIPKCGVFEFTRNNRSILKVDPKTWEESELISFSDTYINGQNENLDIVWATNDKVVLFAEDQGPTGGLSTTHLICLSKADKNPNAGKKILRLAYINNIFVQEYGAINTYNRNSDKYFIETDSKYYDIANGIFYADGWEYDLAEIVATEATAVDSLKADIRVGEGPDLVFYSSDSAQLNNSEYLVDLTKRVNAEKSLNNGDYMDFVTKPNGRNGMHFRLDYSFDSVALVVNNSYIDDGTKGVTFDQYNSVINNYNAGTSILYKDDLALMKLLMENSDSLSYDRDGKIILGNDSFNAVNEYIASIPDNMPNDDNYWVPKKKIQLVDGMNFNSFAYLYGDVYKNYSIIGLPSSDGHAEVIRGRGIGITTCCSLQDAAWEFAMTLMSSEYQNQMNIYYDPVLKSAQKNMFESYVDIKNARRNPYVASDIPLNKDIVDYYIEQISDAVTMPDIDSGIIVIMNEEMPAYYSGQKTLDEVSIIIENRVNLMLSEQG